MSRFFYQNGKSSKEKLLALHNNSSTGVGGPFFQSYCPSEWENGGDVFERIDTVFHKLNLQTGGTNYVAILSALMLGSKDEHVEQYSYEDVMNPEALTDRKKDLLKKLETIADESDREKQAEELKKLNDSLAVGGDIMAEHFEQRLKEEYMNNPSEALQDPDAFLESELVGNILIGQLGLDKKTQEIQDHQAILPSLKYVEAVSRDPLARFGAAIKMTEGVPLKIPKDIADSNVKAMNILEWKMSFAQDSFREYPKESTILFAEMDLGSKYKEILSEKRNHESVCWTNLNRSFQEYRELCETVRNTKKEDISDKTLRRIRENATALFRYSKQYLNLAKKSKIQDDNKRIDAVTSFMMELSPAVKGIADIQKEDIMTRGQDYYIAPFRMDNIKEQKETLVNFKRELDAIKELNSIKSKNAKKLYESIETAIKMNDELQLEILAATEDKDYTYETDSMYFLSNSETAQKYKDSLAVCSNAFLAYCLEAKQNKADSLTVVPPSTNYVTLIEYAHNGLAGGISNDFSKDKKRLEEEKERTEEANWDKIHDEPLAPVNHLDEQPIEKQPQEEKVVLEPTEAENNETIKEIINTANAVFAAEKTNQNINANLIEILEDENSKPTGCTGGVREYFTKHEELINDLGGDLFSHFRMYCLTHGVSDEEMLAFGSNRTPDEKLKNKISGLKLEFFKMLTDGIAKQTKAIEDYYVDVANYIENKIQSIASVDSIEKIKGCTNELILLSNMQGILEQGLRLGEKEDKIPPLTKQIVENVDNRLKEQGKNYRLNQLDGPFRSLDYLFSSLYKFNKDNTITEKITCRSAKGGTFEGSFEFESAAGKITLAIIKMQAFRQLDVKKGVNPDRPIMERTDLFQRIDEANENKTTLEMIADYTRTLPRIASKDFDKADITNKLQEFSTSLVDSQKSFYGLFTKKTPQFEGMKDALTSLNSFVKDMREAPLKRDFGKYVTHLEEVQKSVDVYVRYKTGNINSNFAANRFTAANKLAEFTNEELKRCREVLEKMGETVMTTENAYVETRKVEELKANYQLYRENRFDDPKLGARPIAFQLNGKPNINQQKLLDQFYDDMREHSTLRNHFNTFFAFPAVKVLHQFVSNQDNRELSDANKAMLMDSVAELVAYGIVKKNPAIANTIKGSDDMTGVANLVEKVKATPDFKTFEQNVKDGNKDKILEVVNGVLKGDGEPLASEAVVNNLRENLGIDAPQHENSLANHDVRRESDPVAEK